ncbi:MAG: hypothetical protein NT074_02610 [Methanomicrobiales archaeon]|jgi:hypothetical protein|nr:hypothetical protein [Methanomicrobiales archaeon]
MDVSAINFVTNAGTSFVGATGDYPTTVHYDLSATGFPLGTGMIPAIGTITVFARGHIMEGREGGIDPVTGQILKASDLVFSEETTASGLIYNFQKSIDYTSGVRIV